MVNIRAPFRIFAALTFPLTKSAAAHAQPLHTRVSGVVDDEPFGAAETHVRNTRVSGDGADIPQAFVGAVRAAHFDISSNTANGASGTAPSYGNNNRFAGNGGVSAVTAIGVMSNEFGQR